MVVTAAAAGQDLAAPVLAAGPAAPAEGLSPPPRSRIRSKRFDRWLVQAFKPSDTLQARSAQYYSFTDQKISLMLDALTDVGSFDLTAPLKLAQICPAFTAAGRAAAGDPRVVVMFRRRQTSAA